MGLHLFSSASESNASSTSESGNQDKEEDEEKEKMSASKRRRTRQKASRRKAYAPDASPKFADKGHNASHTGFVASPPRSCRGTSPEWSTSGRTSASP